jgi:hypothetical protein
MWEYCCHIKGMPDSLRNLGEPIPDRTLVLNLLCGLNPHDGYLKALIKRNELLLEELTMAIEAPAPALALYNAPPNSQASSGG